MSTPITEIRTPTNAGDVNTETSKEMELLVLEHWRSVLQVPDAQLDDNFFELGGHSLLAARMLAKLGSKINRKVPVSWLIESPTARTLADRLQNARELHSESVVVMQPKGSLPPIYFIHHLLGDVLVYRAMADCFAPARPVYGIQAPVDLTTRTRPYPLASLAAEYVSHILRHQSTGPFHLAGYSSGSVLAFEMARQLSAAGYKLGLLAFIDGGIGESIPAIPKPDYYWRVFVRKMCKIAFKFTDALNEGPREFIRNRFGHMRFLWRMRHLESDANLTLEEALLLSERAYSPQPYHGSALLIRFRNEARKFGPDPLMGWAAVLADRLEVIDAPGGHTTGMDSDFAPQLAAMLEVRMAMFENSSE